MLFCNFCIENLYIFPCSDNRLILYKEDFIMLEKIKTNKCLVIWYIMKNVRDIYWV
jgi:hypothetical protein